MIKATGVRVNRIGKVDRPRNGLEKILSSRLEMSNRIVADPGCPLDVLLDTGDVVLATGSVVLDVPLNAVDIFAILP